MTKLSSFKPAPRVESAAPAKRPKPMNTSKDIKNRLLVVTIAILVSSSDSSDYPMILQQFPNSLER